MTFEVKALPGDIYQLTVVDDQKTTTYHLMTGGEVRQLIQTLDNAIL